VPLSHKLRGNSNVVLSDDASALANVFRAATCPALQTRSSQSRKCSAVYPCWSPGPAVSAAGGIDNDMQANGKSQTVANKQANKQTVRTKQTETNECNGSPNSHVRSEQGRRTRRTAVIVIVYCRAHVDNSHHVINRAVLFRDLAHAHEKRRPTFHLKIPSIYKSLVYGSSEYSLIIQ
jgi:hypothetical protein